MKYYNLPTSQQIADYHAGQLSMENNQWIEKLMSSNPFVKSAVEDFPLDQQHEVQTISERISGKINKNYLQKRGFWNRFGSWISLSMVLLLIGVLAVLNMSPDNKYTQQSILLADEQVEKENLKPDAHEDKVQNTEHVTAQKTIEKTEKENLTETASIKTTVQTETQETETAISSEASKVSTAESDSKTKEQTKLSGKLLKSVRSVNLVSKDFDALFKRNLPEFPGGDRALFDYFRTQLKPVELDYSESVFDAAVTVHLVVNKKGVTSTYEVEGALHPIHEKQLENCVAKLPRFKPGQSDVTYIMEIIFN